MTTVAPCCILPSASAQARLILTKKNHNKSYCLSALKPYQERNLSQLPHYRHARHTLVLQRRSTICSGQACLIPSSSRSSTCGCCWVAGNIVLFCRCTHQLVACVSARKLLCCAPDQGPDKKLACVQEELESISGGPLWWGCISRLGHA